MPTPPTNDFIDHLHEEFLERLRAALREWQAARRDKLLGPPPGATVDQQFSAIQAGMRRLGVTESALSALADEWLHEPKESKDVTPSGS